MGTKRRIEIRVQTHQVLKIHNSSQITLGWCEVCKQQVEMIALEKATDLNSQSLISTNAPINADKLHINRIDDNRLLVCLRSMME